MRTKGWFSKKALPFLVFGQQPTFRRETKPRSGNAYKQEHRRFVFTQAVAIRKWSDPGGREKLQAATVGGGMLMARSGVQVRGGALHQAANGHR